MPNIFAQAAASNTAESSGVRKPNTSLRASVDGALVVNDGHAKYANIALGGNLWYGSTAVGGQAPGTAIGTTAAISLYNPVASNKILSLLDTTAGYLSGTLGAGFITYAVDPVSAVAPTGGTAIVARSAIQSGATAAGVIATGTTTANTPNIGRTFGCLGASLASSAITPWQLRDNVDGLLALIQGRTLSLQGVAAGGTSPLLVFQLFWEELNA